MQRHGLAVAFLDVLRRVSGLSIGTPASDPGLGQIAVTGASWEALGPYDQTAGLVLQGDLSLGAGSGPQSGPVYVEATDGHFMLSSAYPAETGAPGYPVVTLTPGGAPVAFETYPFSFGQWAKFNDHPWDVWVSWFNATRSGNPYVQGLVSQHLQVYPLYRDPNTGQPTGGQITLPNGQVVGGAPAPSGPTSTPPTPQPAPPPQQQAGYRWPLLRFFFGWAP